MTDYIDREALQKLFNDVSTSLLSRGELAKDAEHMVRAFLMVTEMIQDAPAVDVEPVRHGRWLGKPGLFQGKCSICGYMTYDKTADWVRAYWPYCPNCGNPMDGGGENG